MAEAVWECELLLLLLKLMICWVPVHTGQCLVGLLALNNKRCAMKSSQFLLCCFGYLCWLPEFSLCSFVQQSTSMRARLTNVHFISYFGHVLPDAFAWVLMNKIHLVDRVPHGRPWGLGEGRESPSSPEAGAEHLVSKWWEPKHLQKKASVPHEHRCASLVLNQCRGRRAAYSCAPNLLLAKRRYLHFGNILIIRQVEATQKTQKAVDTLGSLVSSTSLEWKLQSWAAPAIFGWE